MTTHSFPSALFTYIDKLHFSYQGPESIAGLETYQVNFTDWNLALSDKNPCIWVKNNDIHEGSIYQLVDRLLDIVRQKNWQNETILVFVDKEATNLKQIVPLDLPTFIIFDHHDQDRVCKADSPTAETLDILLTQLPRSRLAPYEKHKPVIAGQFFGRKTEITKMLNHPKKNFLIVGIRRIGKTSLMKEVMRRMDETDKPEPGQSRRLYVDCSVFESQEDFLKEITYRLDRNEIKLLLRSASQSMRYRSLMFERFYNIHGGMVTFFVDELDRMLIRMKDPNAFYDILRAAWMSEKARFILAGFRRPFSEVFSELSASYNMVETIRLSRLPFKEVYQMVTLPMERLRITIQNRDGVVNRIYRETAGLPNYIQFYCSTLLAQLDERNDSLLSEEDLSGVYEDPEFRDFILETFMANTEPVEQALVFSLLLEVDDPTNQRNFSPRAIDGILKKRRLNLRLEQLDRVCRNLEIAGIFNQIGQNYEFAVPLLKQTLLTRDLEFMLEKRREQILAERLLI